MLNKNTYTGPSFSLGNKVARILWEVVAAIFFRLSPKPFHAWRALLLQLFGATVGKGVHIYPGVKIWAPWNLVLGKECGVASGAILYSQGVITIGDRAVISQGAHIVAGTHDYTKIGFPVITKPVIIGEYAWIAADVFVHPGVCIGDGCVIGARSVVTRDMPEWMVCYGHPCVPVKKRLMVDYIVTSKL